MHKDRQLSRGVSHLEAPLKKISQQRNNDYISIDIGNSMFLPNSAKFYISTQLILEYCMKQSLYFDNTFVKSLNSEILSIKFMLTRQTLDICKYKPHTTSRQIILRLYCSTIHSPSCPRNIHPSETLVCCSPFSKLVICLPLLNCDLVSN